MKKRMNNLRRSARRFINYTVNFYSFVYFELRHVVAVIYFTLPNNRESKKIRNKPASILTHITVIKKLKLPLYNIDLFSSDLIRVSRHNNNSFFLQVRNSIYFITRFKSEAFWCKLNVKWAGIKRALLGQVVLN